MKFKDFEGLTTFNAIQKLNIESKETKYSDDIDGFLRLISELSKRKTSIGLAKLFHYAKYYLDKNNYLNCFYNRDLGFKLECIRDLLQFLFIEEKELTSLHFTENGDNTLSIKVNNNSALIKEYLTPTLDQLILLDFFSTTGIISIRENIKIYMIEHIDDKEETDEIDNSFLRNPDSLQFELVDESLNSFIEKLIESYENFYDYNTKELAFLPNNN